MYAKRKWVDAALTLPFGKTMPKITLNADGSLVTLLRRLGEQLHNDLRDWGRDILQPLVGRHGPSGDMAVDQLHGIGSRKRQRAGEHFVKRYAKGVEIAAGIDRAVHPSGLFGRHVGERPRNRLGRIGRLALARHARNKAKPGEPHARVRAVDHDIGRLDVLVDEAALVKLAHSRGDSDCEAQEAPHVHGRAKQPVERVAVRILEHQHGPTALAHELQWSHRPRAVELVLQPIFVSEAIKAARGGMLRGGNHDKHGGPGAVIRLAPSSAEDALAILPQDREITILICAKSRGWVQLPDSAAKPIALFG